uniref:Late endosomal/lysosomal adaptor and MAPK and MTOR activator 5 n=1 Tax=Setaria digitata TaxID=48799 RepID=A0A915PKF1_9BILA
MESQLEKMSREQVKGILCADESGLNVCNRGTLNSTAGDVTVNLLKLASNLEPNLPTSSIVIQLTGVDGSVLSIAKEGNLTTAVHCSDRSSHDLE